MSMFSTYLIEWSLWFLFLFQGAVGAAGAKKCNLAFGELNNPKCYSTQKCVWSFHYQSGVCIEGSGSRSDASGIGGAYNIC